MGITHPFELLKKSDNGLQFLETVAELHLVSQNALDGPMYVPGFTQTPRYHLTSVFTPFQ
jgi:hypothetical protein